MKRFTRAYWIFWLGLLPLVYWSTSPDYEFPKFMIFLATVNLWGIAYLWKTKNNFLKIENQIDKLVVVIAIVTTISWVINGFKINGLIGEGYRYQGLITIWSLIEWYMLSKKMVIDKNGWSILLKLIGIGLTLIALFYPMMGNPNFIAAYLVLLSAGQNLAANNVGVGIIAWISDSRSAGIAWLTSVLLMIKNKFFLIVMIILGSVLIVLFPKKLPSHFDNRQIIWEKSIELIIKKPILGWGPENFETAFTSVLKEKDFDLKNVRVDRAHNIALDILANTGIVGLVIWLLLFHRLFKESSRSEKVFLIAFLIIASLNVINLNTWLLFYMTAACISQKSPRLPE